MKDKEYSKLLKAKELMENDEYFEAVPILRRLYKKSPNNLEIRLELGKAESFIGEFSKSRYYLESLYGTNYENAAIFALSRLEIVTGNIERARYYLASLLNTKKKEFAILELSMIELSEGNIEMVESYINKLSKDFLSSYIFRLKMYIMKEDYLGGLKYIEEIMDRKDIDIQLIKQYKFYMEYKLEKVPSDTKVKKYLPKQIIDYDEQEAIKHIKSHLDEDDNQIIHSVFDASVNIKDLFYKAKKCLKDAKIKYNGIVDKHIICLDNVIGTWNNHETKNLQIVTIHDTDNIITMYPYIHEYNIEQNMKKQISLKR